MPAAKQLSYDEQLADDIAQFYDDPLGFVMYAYEWGTDPALRVCKLPEHYQFIYDSEYGPDEWACELLERIGRQVREHRFDGQSAVEPIREAISSGHGIGKAHAYSTLVPTPTGHTRWGDLQPGDHVFDATGAPVRIVQTHHYAQMPMYRVTFDDGASVDVSSGHLWSVRGRQERRNGLDSWRTMETIDLLKAGVKRLNGAAMARQWEVPVQGPAQFEARDTPLHPYLLGVWLGDGHKGAARYSKPHREIAERLRAFGYDVSQAGPGGAHYVRNIVHLMADPVFQCGSHERYIPDDYKFNTVPNRLELLRGLCDTDGEVHGSGSIGYSTTSKRLADDVVWLARSLGCKAMLQPTVKRGWYPGSDGWRITCRDCYRVTINAPINPFTLTRRKTAYRPSEARYLKRWIDSIEPIAPADGMCITVANADGLYQANDFVVTHNSAMSSWLINWIMSTRPHAKGVVTANTAEQLASKTWAELSKWSKRCITGHWFDITTGKGAMRMTHKQYPESWRCDAQTCREENSESFAGLHAASSTPFYLFDEASAIPAKIWEVSEGGMTDGEPMWFAFGNPTRNSGKFFDCFNSMRHRWGNYHVDSRTVQITNKQTIQQWVDDYGEDSDFVRVRVRGVFPRASSMQFIGRDLVDDAMSRPLPFVSKVVGSVAVVGVDVARFGDDQSVIRTRIARDARSIPAKKFRGLDTMQLAVKVAEHINYLKRDMGLRVVVFVDGGGVGGGVIDRLRQLDYDVIEVQFGGKADDERKYFNKRSEMWGRLREALPSLILDSDEALATDLTSPEYTVNDRDQIVLERKKDMKARGLASPDDGDALALTYAQPVHAAAAILDAHDQSAQSASMVRNKDHDPFADI